MSETHTLRAAFNLERMPFQVWAALQLPDKVGDTFAMPGVLGGSAATACTRVILLTREVRGMRARLLDPAQPDSVIEVRVEPADASGWPTHVTLEQSGVRATANESYAELDSRWRRVVSDIEIVLRYDVRIPHQLGGLALGASFRPERVGLIVLAVDPTGIAHRAGLASGDLLVGINDARILDLSALNAVLEILRAAREIKLEWIRDGHWVRQVLTCG